METGYKVFKTSVLKSINLKEKSFSFEPEVTIKLAKKKYKFFEVPVTYNGRSYEDGKKIGKKYSFKKVNTLGIDGQIRNFAILEKRKKKILVSAINNGKLEFNEIN